MMVRGDNYCTRRILVPLGQVSAKVRLKKGGGVFEILYVNNG